MQKRIDALTVRKLAVNERMEVAKEVCDVQGYKEATTAYNRLAREITWLSDVQSLIRPPIVANDYDELNFDKIAIRLRFGSVRVVTPFNVASVLERVTPQSARLDTIDVQPLSCQFVYSLDLDRFPPAAMIAKQINREWIFADAQVDLLVRGVDIANIALAYIEQRKDDVSMGGTLEWPYALGFLQVRGHSVQVEKMIDADPYLLQIKDWAGICWGVAENLIYYYLKRQVYKIDWQPFPEMK